MDEILDHNMKRNSRYVPLVRDLKIRTTIGFILLILSTTLSTTAIGKGRIEITVTISILAWLLAIFLTDKYVHKYPQRYYQYLIASHLKAAIIMAFFLWIMSRIVGLSAAPYDVFVAGFVFFILADTLVSIPRRSDILDQQFSSEDSSIFEPIIAEDSINDSRHSHAGVSSIDKQAIVRQIRSNLDKPTIDFIEKNLPDSQGDNENVLVLDDIDTTDNQFKSVPVGLLIGRTRLNDVHRLNMFLLFCVKRISMGGYFVTHYMPLENTAKKLKDRYEGALYWAVVTIHYIWYRAIPKIPWLDTLYFSPKIPWLDTFILSLTKKRNRVLSKAEVWGRLSYCGMHVIAESKGDCDIYFIAQHVADPIQSRSASYYPIVTLEKVGLGGEIIRTHKIRTMFPFSEFIQQRIFQDHGLASTGKFRNDFRLTGFGRFLRKYWLDELPQIFDWLRGDVKLVGIRATSRHFLTLYPKKFLHLYIQIKPGLIPPIFDESTNGFDQIVEIELKYLQNYWREPFRTDMRYLIQTFIDIVFKGVRSK